MSSCERFKSRKTRVSSNLQHKGPKSRKSKVTYPGCKFSENILDSRSGTRPSSKRGRRPRNKGNSKHHIKGIPLFQSNSVRQCFNPIRQILDQDDYISSDGQIYAVGETAYIQSDTISTPYFIGQILDFKTTRKDEILAEIQWYYRPSEVPASVLDSLVQDRCLQADNLEETISHSLIDKQVRSRELFRSGLNSNVDCCNITSVSLFRGKCNVLSFSEILNLKDFTKKDDNFFCILGFDPITRRLSDFKGEIRIGASHQATLPTASKTSNLSDVVIESLLWSPNMIEDSELQMYLKATRSVSMHSGWCLRGRIDDGILAMQSDRLTQNSYDLLSFDNYCTKTSLRHILQKPNAFDIIYEKSWTQDEAKNFYKGIRKVGKNFNKIRDEFLPEKSVCELVYYYYHWKRSTVGLASRSQRKTRKALHLKKNHNDCSNSHLSLHDLFIEMYSADELEEDESILNAEQSEIGPILQSKDAKNRICQHCYSFISKSWHHGGMDNLLLCDVCRIFYCKYAQMPKMPNIADLPLHILRDITKKDLILKINEDRFLMDDISAKSTREISESSDYSDSDSFLSDNERQNIEIKKSNSLIKVSLLYDDKKKQEVINYQPDSYLQLITNQQPSDAHIKQIPDLNFIKHGEMTDFSLQNRGSILSSELSKDNYEDFTNHCEDIHLKNSLSPKRCEDCANRCILKSLLQSTGEKSPLNSSDIHVIVHDQDGFKVSTTSYVDNCIDDSTIEALSESPSPTMKRDFLLFSSEPRQGAARLDFQPKSNISELIDKRPQNMESSLVSTRSKDSSTNTTNVPIVTSNIAAISHVPNSYFNPYSNFITSQLSNQSRNNQQNTFIDQSSKDSSRLYLLNHKHNSFDYSEPQNVVSSQSTSKIPFQLIDSSCQQSKPCYNSSIADKYIPKASISSQSLSHIGYNNAETDSALSYSNPTVHNFILPSSSKCKPSSAEAKPSIPTVISASEIESRELNQNSTTNMGSSNTLQPQIPSSTHMFESSMIHNFTSDSSCAKSNQSVPNFQLSSKTTHTPSVINLSNLNPLPTIISNNMLVNQVHETNAPPHYLNFAPTNDKFTVDISNIEQDKNVYQNYMNLLQNHFYSNQMNTYFLSQIPSLSHSNQQLQVPYHGQLFHPQVNNQMSHIAQIPPQFFQAQPIHSSQSPTKPAISGILPIPNDIIQLSSLPFRVSSEQLSSSDLNDNTK